MKTIKVLLLLGLFTSCAATRYGMVVGGQKADYTETASATSLFGSSSVDIEDFETSGNGFHVGISEETKSVLTKITYFQTSYDEQLYTIDGTSYAAELKESGIRGTIAWKLGFFQPYIGFVSYSAEVSGEITDQKEFDSSYGGLTYGADLEFQFSKRGFIYLGYGVDSYEATDIVSTVMVDQTIDHSFIRVGLRFNFSDQYTSMWK